MVLKPYFDLLSEDVNFGQVSLLDGNLREIIHPICLPVLASTESSGPDSRARAPSGRDDA